MSETQGRYSFDIAEKRRLKTKDLVRLYPFGVSLLPDPQRPLLLLKDKSGEKTLPVAINPLEAGVTLTQFNRSMSTSPHRVTELLLQSLDIKIEKCVFVEIRGQFQFVRLYLKGHPVTKSLKCRAEEAMSLCLQLNVEIYATPEFMLASREMNMKAAMQASDSALAVSNKGQGYIQ